MQGMIQLILLTQIKEKLVVVLQLRGIFKPKTRERESWPGGCTLTCQAALKDTDSDILAVLISEVRDRLGESMASLIEEERKNLRYLSDEKKVLTYTLYLKDLMLLDTMEDSGLRFAERNDLRFTDLRNYNELQGVPGRAIEILALLPDDLNAIKEAFKLYE